MTRSLVAFGDIDVPDVDSAFEAIIAGSHQVATRVDVLFNREAIAEGLPATDGSVTADRTAAIMSSCSVEIADPLRVPVAADDILTPYGYELRVWRGVTVPGGSLMAPLGVFPIQRSSVDGTTLLSSITGQDRSKLVSDAIFEDTYQIAAGTNYATAIQAVIEAGASGLTFLFPSTTFTTPLLTFGPDDNRWDVVRNMARNIGNEILFDGLGRCVMRAEPSFQDTPVGEISEGVNMLSATFDLDREPAHNRVVATSSNSSLDQVFRGVATDNDPASPTYYFGPFGKKARPYSSPFLASNAQCESAAAAILASNLGVAKAVSVSALTDPRREPSDVVRVRRAALGLDELHIIDKLTIGLSAGDSMSAVVRSQQVAA